MIQQPVMMPQPMFVQQPIYMMQNPGNQAKQVPSQAQIPVEVKITRKTGCCGTKQCKLKGLNCVFTDVQSYEVEGLKDLVTFLFETEKCCASCKYIVHSRFKPIIRSDKQSGLEIIGYYSNYIDVWYYDQKVGVVEKSSRVGCCAGANCNGCCNCMKCCLSDWIYSFSQNPSKHWNDDFDFSVLKPSQGCCSCYQYNCIFCCCCCPSKYDNPCCYEWWDVEKPPGQKLFKYQQYNTCYEWWCASWFFPCVGDPGMKHAKIEFPDNFSNNERVGLIAAYMINQEFIFNKMKMAKVAWSNFLKEYA